MLLSGGRCEFHLHFTFPSGDPQPKSVLSHPEQDCGHLYVCSPKVSKGWFIGPQLSSIRACQAAMKRLPLSSQSLSRGPLPPARVGPFKAPGVTSFRVMYSPVPQPAFAARFILDDTAHVLREATQQRLAERDKNTLWWNITSNQLSEKRVIRSWCCRRARGAIVEALRAKGYDREGRVLPNTGARPPLTGSLQLRGTEELITVKFSDLQKQAALLVDALVERSSRVARPSPREASW